MEDSQLAESLMRDHFTGTAALIALMLKNLPDDVRTRTHDAVRKGAGKVELRTHVESNETELVLVPADALSRCGLQRQGMNDRSPQMEHAMRARFDSIESRALKGPEAMALSKLHSFHMDIFHVCSFCNAIDEIREKNPHKRAVGPEADALRIAIVITYIRMFNSGVRLGDFAMKDLVAELYDSAEKDLHDYVFDLRNKNIAHSVNVFEEFFATVNLDASTTPPKVVSIGCDGIQTHGVNDGDIARLREMVIKLRNGLAKEVEREQQALLAVAQKMTPEQISALPLVEPELGDRSEVNTARTQKRPKV
jgi:hypothetical protein